jgi:hypothetical protein
MKMHMHTTCICILAAVYDATMPTSIVRARFLERIPVLKMRGPRQLLVGGSGSGERGAPTRALANAYGLGTPWLRHGTVLLADESSQAKRMRQRDFAAMGPIVGWSPTETFSKKRLYATELLLRSPPDFLENYEMKI